MRIEWQFEATWMGGWVSGEIADVIRVKGREKIGAASCLTVVLPGFKPSPPFLGSHLITLDVVAALPDHASLPRVSNLFIFSPPISVQPVVLLSQGQQRQSSLPRLLVKAEAGRWKELKGS